MSKILRNDGGVDVVLTDVGVTVAAASSYTVPPQDYPAFSASGDAIKALADSTLILNDGSSDVLDLSKAVDILKGWPVQVVSASSDPFFFDYSGTVVGDDAAVILEHNVNPVNTLELTRIYVECRRESIVQVFLSGEEIARLVTGPGKPIDSFDWRPNKICVGGSVVVVQIQKRPGLPDTDAGIHLMGIQTS